MTKDMERPSEISSLEQQEEEHRHISTMFRNAFKIAAGAAIGLTTVVAAERSTRRLTGPGALLMGVSAVGLLIAGEVFDSKADTAGVVSEILADGHKNRV